MADGASEGKGFLEGQAWRGSVTSPSVVSGFVTMLKRRSGLLSCERVVVAESNSAVLTSAYGLEPSPKFRTPAT